jgi:benzoate/toluate 1,2-dioxygenase subunit alpha
VPRKRGNKGTFTCPFHGWTFKNDGKLLKAKNEKKGAYPDSFKQEGSHDLKRCRASRTTRASCSAA